MKSVIIKKGIRLIMLLPLLISGCGSGDSSDKGEVPKPNLGTGTGTGTGTTAVLKGKWSTGCIPSDDSDIYYARTIEYFDDTVTFSKIEYLESSCSLKYATDVLNHSYMIGKTKYLSTGNEVKEIDYIATSRFMSASVIGVVQSFNVVKFCGYENWEVNKLEDVSNCRGLPLNKYDIFQIEGKKLFFGDLDFGDSETLESRPTQLSDAFVKKI